MKEYLIFRLYGPMASWGDIAVGQHRPTYDHPSKSAIFGLIAAALGIRRDEEERHLELSNAYSYGTLINSAGKLLRDYHTSQVPSAGTGRNRKTFATRKDELAVPKEELNTVLSTRDYYCDGVYTVILSCKTDTPPYSLELLGNSLKEPSFCLYLGRKSCPLALPINPKIVSASNIKEALQSVDPGEEGLVKKIEMKSPYRLYWDDPKESMTCEHTISRYDKLLSRKRWQFSKRNEYYAMVSLEG
ncbi:type I-E CRISPR-associated protein Cas5/CasD [Methanococcoides burtonii]|uniref:CRISPR-associated protein, CT1976-like n=1 Tax=Methanococcoides burtonii (strain DSM 6242 / NBRC 107633 / OCM 468 / ACE-M) TaxID=259564 RepID=Q12YA8_METBU|nr:type I-E CRISPR-associated protein Cas5/CasD [Methanococcoides burtonii]ABE51568.1 CRISPR-associated protein, CT1976-like [Methanococcoides burtonii DSM 6242]